MKHVVILTITVVGLTLFLIGCSTNESRVNELESAIADLELENVNLKNQIKQFEEQVTELKILATEKGNDQDEDAAIAQFAQEALELQGVLMDTSYEWVAWYHQNLPDNYPRYTNRNKEIETLNEADRLGWIVRDTISAIELLYAPSKAIEIKRELLSEGDSLLQAITDIVNFYAAPDVRPVSLFDDAWEFINHGELNALNTWIKRELIDLQLEYGRLMNGLVSKKP